MEVYVTLRQRVCIPIWILGNHSPLVESKVHTRYAPHLWRFSYVPAIQPEESAYRVCTFDLATRGQCILGMHSPLVVWWLRTKIGCLLVCRLHILHSALHPVPITMACASGTSVRTLRVDTSSRSGVLEQCTSAASLLTLALLVCSIQ